MKKTFFTYFTYAGAVLCLLVLASCVSAPAPMGAVFAEPAAASPDWVRDPYTRFDRGEYLAAVGSGNSRAAAESDALGRLVGIFGQSIQVDTRVTETYREVMSSGAGVSWIQTAGMDSSIAITAGMDTLIGAEIRDFWEDGRGAGFAVAVLNKPRARQIYSEMLRANQEIIAGLTGMPLAQRNTIDGFSRFQFAAVLADMSVSYAEILAMIGAPQYAQGLRRGDDFRREANEIARAIPVSVNVQGDMAGRISGAFASVFTELGFNTGGTNPRYRLDVNVIVLPVETAGQNVFARIDVAANLIDTTNNAVLLPFSFNEREGHRTASEANNRAFLIAERRIREEYRDLLRAYMSRLNPRR